MSQPLFGLVPAGQPVITQPSETPTPTSFLYTVPAAAAAVGAAPPGGGRPFSHVVVFLLPGVVLPPGTAAAIYLVTPPDPAAGRPAPVPRFLGGVGPGKESAIFKLGPDAAAAAPPQQQQVILGVSIEDGASVGARIDELAAAKGAASLPTATLALVPAPKLQQQPTTLVLAQRIIKNAFNFLSSFAGQAGAVEVVPMKAFEDWWRKFESRVRTDPGFLERDD